MANSCLASSETAIWKGWLASLEKAMRQCVLAIRARLFSINGDGHPAVGIVEESHMKMLVATRGHMGGSWLASSRMPDGNMSGN